MARTKTSRPRRTTRKTNPPVSRVRSAHFWTGIGVIALGVVLLAYLLFGVGLYLGAWKGDTARSVTNVLYYPAASVLVPGFLGYYLLSILMLLLLVGSFVKLAHLLVARRFDLDGKTVVTIFIFLAAVASLFSVPKISDTVVNYHDYLERVKAFDRLEQAQTQQGGQESAQATPADVKESRALTQLLSNNVVRQEAIKFDVTVSRKEVNDFYKQYADQSQGEEQLRKRLKDVLGWTPAQFKEELRVQLLKQKLQEKLQSDDKVNEEKKRQAEDYLKQVKDGKDFAALAQQSGDPTAQAGGDQGFVKKGELPPEIESVAFSLQPGQTSEIIKTSRGYVIIKVEEKKGGEEVRIRQILVRTTSLAEFIPEQLKDTKVSVYVKGLVWDKNLNAVQPKNAQQTQPTTTDTPVPAASAPASPAAQ